MDPIMIGIAAVVILVIIAGVFMMKKGKTNTTIASQSNVKRPKTLAEQQRELELQRQSQNPAPAASLPQSQSAVQPTQQAQPVNHAQSSADSDLQTAEQLIQNQDYEGAITILRRVVKNNPRQAAAYFALLNAYALAKDYQHFNAFYPEVLALNDDSLTAQAKTLKSLVDEEQSISMAISQKANTETDKADGLDFDLFDVTQGTDKPATTDALSATALDTPTISGTAQPTHIADHKTETDLDLDFDLDAIDTKQTDPVVTANAPAAKVAVDEISFDDLDINFDLPNTAGTPPAPTVESYTEIFAPVSTAPAEPIKTPTATVDSDFDFDFDLPQSQSTPMAPADAVLQPVVDTTTRTSTAEKTINSLDDDLDFDFDLEVEPVNAVVAAPATNTITEHSPEVGLTLDPVDSNESPKLSSDELVTPHGTTDAPAQPDALKISDEMFDFSLEDEVVKEPVATTAITTIQPKAGDDILDFSVDEPAANQVTPSEPSSIAATSELTTAPVVEDLSAVFEAIKDIDSATLNVELAEQYLNLGEYDSAKRLLDEVQGSDNPALLQRVEALRQRIA